MTCPKCKATISNESAFCPCCGENLAAKSNTDNKFCSSCGTELKEDHKFCPKCGAATKKDTQANTNTNIKPNVTYRADNSSSKKIRWSYDTSIVSAIISLIIRLKTQEIYYSYENLLKNKKVLGIDEDTKPFLTVIPIIAAIITSLLIVSDKTTSSQKKTTAFIINAVFIALSILFIWFDIPYSIIDF